MLQKTLADKTTAKFDFKKSLKGSLPIGILNFLWCMYMFVVSPVYCLAFTPYLSKIYAFILMDVDEDVLLVYKIVILCIGAVFSFAVFNTISNKKANNFHFANGLTRNTYYFNRVKASVTVMLISTLIPVIIDVALNIRYFGHTGYILQYGLVMYLEYISILLVGFAAASVCSVVSYTKGIAIITTGAVIAAPTVFTNAAIKCMGAFLRGFAGDYYWPELNRYIGRLGYEANYTDSSYTYFPEHCFDAFKFVSSADKIENEAVEFINTPIELIVPIIYWLAVGVVAIYIGKVLI
ncbi:MAG: hypothetical protein ACI4IF_08060, partial [Acutalibacteraceae bacterium]